MKTGIKVNAGFFENRVKCEMVDIPEEIDLSAIAKELGFEWCEIVRPRGLKGKFVMIVDEEGALKFGNSANFLATKLYGGVIYGNVMIMKEVFGNEGPELAGLDESDIPKAIDIISSAMKGGD